jgi:hypothetical protein
METKQLQLVTPRQGEMLEELGFNWKTEYVYDNSDGTPKLKKAIDYYNTGHAVTSAPIIAHALKWMRDEKDLKNEIRFYYCSDSYETCYYQGFLDYKKT